MTARTPAAIFDEVLDAWDALERARILDGLPKQFTATQALQQEDEMTRHLAQVRAYREEFREAMLRPCEHGPGQVCRECRGPHELVGTGSGTVVLSYDECRDVLDDLELDDPEPTPEEEPGCIEPSDEVDALFDDIFDTESVPDRAERLAARYTKDDGSAK